MRKSFTLSEVLIAIVVIGVIAAVALPVVTASYPDRMYIPALKKNFSVMSNAFNLSKKYEYIDYTDWNRADGNVDALYNDYLILKKYLYVIRECKDTAGCWSKEKTKDPSGEVSSSATEKGIGSSIVTFTLNDGTNVCLDYWSKSDVIQLFGVSENLLEDTLSIWVDVNGDKKPNKMGKDVFSFILTKEGVVPSGKDNNSANCDSSGFDCSAKFLKNDYR